MGGALSVGKEKRSRSIFLKLVDLQRYGIIFSQELYENFVLKKDRPFFFSFEADKFMCGFSFADEGDAAKLHKHVERETPVAGRSAATAPSRSAPATVGFSSTANAKLPKKKKKKKKKRGWFGSASDDRRSMLGEISGPTDFRHV